MPYTVVNEGGYPRVLRVCDGLTLSRITYLAVTILNETYY